MSSSTMREGPQNLDGITTETQDLAFELDGERVVAREGESLWDVGACKPVGVCFCWGKFWAHGEKVSWWRSWCGG